MVTSSFGQSLIRQDTLDITRIAERFGAILPTNPFDTPFTSRTPSTLGSSSALQQFGNGRRYFRSRRVRKGEVEKPWLSKKDPREKWVTIIPVFGIVIGLVLAGLLVYDGLRTVVNHKYCVVLDEDFSSGFNPHVWTKEAEVGGFG